MKRFTILFVTALFALVSSAWADAPQLINFQGRLTDGSGNPVANGTYSVTFRIYDAPTGGSVQWSEAQTVSTTGGIFNVLLGSSTALPATVFDDTTRYLAIQVSPDPEMTPRQRLATVSYSFASNPWATSGSNVFKLNGYVGIGTQSPQVALHIRQTTSSPVVRFTDNNNNETEVGRFGSTWNGLTNPFIIQHLFGSGVNDMVFTPTTNDPTLGLVIKGNTGNIGIGTASPNQKFQVVENTANTGNAAGIGIWQQGTGDVNLNFRVPGVVEYGIGVDRSDGNKFKISDYTNVGNFGTKDRIIIDASGNVGIGTTSPNNRLDVKGSLEVGTGLRGGILQSTNGDNFQFHTFTNTPNPNFAIGYGDGAGGMDFSKEYITANAGNIAFANAKVGILTTAPNSKLQVNGSFATAVLKITANATLTDAQSIVLVDASGGDITVGLPPAAGCIGRQYIIKKTSFSGNVTIDPNGAETIDGSSTIVQSTFGVHCLVIASDGTNWIIISSN